MIRIRRSESWDCSGFPSGCRCWNGCRRAACGTESAVPVRTAEDGLFYVHDRIAGALFSFIPGEAVGYGRPYTGEELRQLSRIVKELHSIPREAFADICPAEAYELPFCDALERLLLSETGGLPEAFRKEAKGRGKCSLAG